MVFASWRVLAFQIILTGYTWHIQDFFVSTTFGTYEFWNLWGGASWKMSLKLCNYWRIKSRYFIDHDQNSFLLSNTHHSGISYVKSGPRIILTWKVKTERVISVAQLSPHFTQVSLWPASLKVLLQFNTEQGHLFSLLAWHSVLSWYHWL